jgi:hypothetical protein
MMLAVLALVVAACTSHKSAPGQGGHAVCLGSGDSTCFGTLAAAVAAAHDGDTVTVRAGTVAGGVTIDKSITLVGAGLHASIIRGGGPVLTIGSLSVTRNLTVSIRDLTVTGGYSRTDRAGACGPDIPICGPGYQKATALGGGIEVLPRPGGLPGARVAISNTAVTGNRAAPATTVPSVLATCPDGPCPASQAAGGGIDNWGALTLTDSVVSDNQAVGELTAQADGGGIVDEANARLTLIGSSVTGNTAAAAPNGRYADGGGIYVDQGGTLTVAHSVIDGNTASLASRFPASVSDSHASTGGVDVQGGATATIGHTSVNGNRVSVTDPDGLPVGYDPGICACDTSAALTLADSKVNGNQLVVNVQTSGVGGSGGGLEADGNAVITRTEVKGNTVTVTSDTGVAAAVAVVNIFFDGTAGQAVIRDSTISGNQVTATSRTGTATVRGAGLANTGPLLLSHVTITGNRATATAPHGWARGGGVFNSAVFTGPVSPPTAGTLAGRARRDDLPQHPACGPRDHRIRRRDLLHGLPRAAGHRRRYRQHTRRLRRLLLTSPPGNADARLARRLAQIICSRGRSDRPRTEVGTPNGRSWCVLPDLLRHSVLST